MKERIVGIILCALFTVRLSTCSEPPLITAVREGDVTEVAQLLRGGANPNLRNNQGEPAIFVGAECRQVQAVRLLIDAGADVNLPSSSGASPLTIAAFAGNAEIVGMLLDAGADINGREDYTPLMAATQYARIEVIKTLIERGADVKAVTTEGRSALLECVQTPHSADGIKDVEAVRLLLDAGADVNRRDRDGNTTLIYAAYDGFPSVVEALVRAGADPSVKNMKGETAFDRCWHRPEIVEILNRKITQIAVGCSVALGSSENATLMKSALLLSLEIEVQGLLRSDVSRYEGL